MSLQFVSDDSGKTTAVLIPIKEWENIVQAHGDLKKLSKVRKKANPKVDADAIASMPAGNAKRFASLRKRIKSKMSDAQIDKQMKSLRKEWQRHI